MNPTPHKPVIGLLGGIGSGKSTVSKLFASLGCAVIDADELARGAMKLPEVLAAVRAQFGAAVFKPDGTLDRPALAALVFSDPAKLATLESLTHPRVHDERARLRAIHQADPAVVAIVEDCPLLLEKKLEGDVDVLVYIEASPEVRLKRVSEKRGWTHDQLKEREKRQLGLDIKANRAQYVVENNATEAHCLTNVRRVLSQILEAQPRH